MAQEIWQSLMVGNRGMRALHNFLKSSVVQIHTKVAIYKILIRPVITYGCETWTVTMKTKSMLAVVETKIYRRI